MKNIAVVTLGLVLPFGVLSAQELTLNELLNNAKEPQRFTKLLEEKRRQMHNKTLANTALEPLRLNHSLSQVDGFERSGVEFDIGFSKELRLGNSQALEQQQSDLSSEAMLLEEKRKIVTFKNGIKNLYHQYCLDLDYVQSFEEGYASLNELYLKKERAYALDEIAKTELLQLKFEQKRLRGQLDLLEVKANNEQAQLLSLSSVESASFSCYDVYPLAPNVSFENNAFMLTNSANEKRKESTQAGLKRYSKKFDSIELSTAYTKELDRNLYTVGVSIPLKFSSNKYEYEKASLLHASSALSLENEQALAQKKYELKVLSEDLSRIYQAIESKQENIAYYKEELLPLMKKSYDYGESSVMEYLLSRQKLYVLEQALLETTKSYYETLFKLYSISEIEETI